MPNFPGSLDALGNPTATTKRNAAGFALATVISTLNDIAEALEAKLGIGADVAAINELLVGTGAGATAFRKLLTADITTGGEIGKRQLNYVAATDVMNSVSMTANTWTDVNTNQSFTVDDANSLVLISVSGCVNVSCGSADDQVGSRILVDSATGYRLGGGIAHTIGEFENALAGAGAIGITGLGAGSHTVRVQAIASITATGICRASSQPNFEALAILVTEVKR